MRTKFGLARLIEDAGTSASTLFESEAQKDQEIMSQDLSLNNEDLRSSNEMNTALASVSNPRNLPDIVTI